jgi:hypothetical protein
MQWCFDIVSGIGWGSLLLMIGAVGVLWLIAAFGMAVLFRTSTQDEQRRASPRTGPHSPPALAENELSGRR